jgi:hypothetical protein
MDIDELWDVCGKNAILSVHPFDRDFIWLTIEAFESLQPYFVESRNWLHPGTNYRSTHSYKHIHAIRQNAHVHMHLDTGNGGFGWRLAVVHVYYDVIPYIWYSLKLRTPLWQLFLKP